MILTHLVLFGFFPGAGGEAAEEVNRGGWLSREQIRDEEEFQRARKKREKELLEEIELAYERLHEEAPQEIAREAAKVVAPYVEGRKPKKALPAPSRVDFQALSRNIAAAEKLLALYQEQQDDEEAALTVLQFV
jgi:hypothetical protein